MNSYEVVKRAAQSSGISTNKVSRSMGKTDNYISSGASRGSTPKADTLAAMLDVCGYTLAAVPVDELPKGALVIDPKGKEE